MAITTSDGIDIVASSPQRRVQFDISGMTCGACAARIERKLNKTPDLAASVNFVTRVATVTAPDAVEDAVICDIVAKAGYTAVVREQGAAASRDQDQVEAQMMFRRLVVSLLLFLPLADLSVVLAAVPSLRFPGWQVVVIGLAGPVVTWCAWPFHRVALRNLRTRSATMESLVSLGVICATVWSIVTIVSGQAESAPTRSGVWAAITASDSIYLEIAAGVTVFVLAGKYFEARARSRAGSALRSLAALTSKDATVILADGSEMPLPSDELSTGQKFVVRPGERIATDGEVVEGRASVDVSIMTGESKPHVVAPGSAVIGGTLSLDGRVVVRAAAVGAGTQLGAMLQLVDAAQSRKAQAQRLADRIASIFVPVVIGLAGVLGRGASCDVAFHAGHGSHDHFATIDWRIKLGGFSVVRPRGELDTCRFLRRGDSVLALSLLPRRCALRRDPATPAPSGRSWAVVSGDYGPRCDHHVRGDAVRGRGCSSSESSVGAVQSRVVQ